MWIDEPWLKGSGNRSDEDVAQLRKQGFTVAVLLLVEDKQPPRYDKRSVIESGWSILPIPIEEGSAPSLERIRESVARLQALPPETKILVFCESGLGRTAFMGAVYWITKGHSKRGDCPHERGIFSY